MYLENLAHIMISIVTVYTFTSGVTYRTGSAYVFRPPETSLFLTVFVFLILKFPIMCFGNCLSFVFAMASEVCHRIMYSNIPLVSSAHLSLY